MNHISKSKITIGYALLLAALLSSLFFVQHEMGSLIRSNKHDMQWSDSLLNLLRKKDSITISLLRTLNEESQMSTESIDSLLAAQDFIVEQQRVQRRVITHRDTIVKPTRKKGFFRRLGEVFRPPKQDTAIQVKNYLEFASDTIVKPYNLADTLKAKFCEANQQKQEANALMQQRKLYMEHLNKLLSARIDTLVKNHEMTAIMQAHAETEQLQSVRNRSTRIISGIAIGAVLLAGLFLILIARDITRSNRYRCELEEAHRRTEELLAIREKLMLAITHDFKAPLGSIIGYAALLSKLTVDERQRFYLDNIRMSSEHLLKLVVDLIDFHRLDLHKVEANRVMFNPYRLMDEIYVCFDPLAQAKGLALHCHISPELQVNYICDPLRLRQIINNLLSNAVKFTDQGSITLAASYEEQSLVVSVADTGKGMKPSDQERIFQEFTRLPEAQGKEGFGLGLSIVRMLVQLLEGSIEVISTPGEGSTFRVRIPISPASTGTLEQAQVEELMPVTGNNGEQASGQAAATAPIRPPHSVLLIDDDRIQLKLTSSMLSQGGMKSKCCLQVDELLDALRASTYDVLLTDVQMPAINGFELLQLLRASNIPQARAIPVIAVTARSDMQRDEFTQHGFAGCLYKPFTVQELLTELGVESVAPCGQPSVSAFPSASLYDFSALTTFSGDDKEAARSILESFISETRANANRLQKAAEANSTDELASVAHKMLPLFKLINASEATALLDELETSCKTDFTETLHAKAQEVLKMADRIVEACNKHLKG